MKRFAWLLLVLCLGCEGSPQTSITSPQDNTYSKIKFRGDILAQYEVIPFVYEECEYLAIRYGSHQLGVAHKGNCKRCERRKTQ